jgi:23S rRNA (pseudouridine1915-N3)-methyltransferase
VKTTKKTTPQAQKEAEGAMILSQIQGGDHVVLLDERGKEFTSRQFSKFIEQKANTVQKNLIFVVGGPYGFSQEVYNRANSLLSLSKMTFPHELIRLFFTEQIYRALTISHNMPYHHD